MEVTLQVLVSRLEGYKPRLNKVNPTRTQIIIVPMTLKSLQI